MWQLWRTYMARITQNYVERHISQQGAEKLLGCIHESKASGPDLIPCRFLKEPVHGIAPILTAITLQEGCKLTNWKNEDVVPINKNSSRNLADNYHPVSLTCVCCKMMKYIITSHIRQSLDQNCILSAFQQGLWKLFSCGTQLLWTLHDLLSFRDKTSKLI